MSRTFKIKVVGLLLCLWQISFSAPIIVDHTCCDLTQVPSADLQNAKNNLVIAYGHTSHGSQLTTGMTSLVGFINGGGLGLSYPADFFTYNSTGASGALQLRDRPFSGASDLGNPDRVAWATATENYLDANPEVNVVIWSWCGQVSSASETDINTYLGLMNQLEIKYSDVQFVYMTGHLDGSGQTGNLNVRNDQIRAYCAANDKILYDFADIESYDPDGLTHYMPLRCNDNCDYDSDGNGDRDANWAITWQNTHTQNVDWYSCSSAHSQALNANRKAYAAWHLWARLAGWDPDPCLDAPSDLGAGFNNESGQVTLTWTDNSSDPDEHGFLIQRQVDNGSWENEYDTVGPNVTTYNELVEADGTYRYRVSGFLSDEGTLICTSSATNVQVVTVGSSSPPNAPSDLQASVSGNRIDLSWTDNSDDEIGFVLERQIDDGLFQELNNALYVDATGYADEALTAGHTYTYRVYAYNLSGDSAYSNTASGEILATSYTIRLESTSEVDDSFLNISNPDQNYGSLGYTSGSDLRYIFKFNFPQQLVGKRILSADLRIYGWGHSGTWTPALYMDLYRVTRSWEEMQVTWNDAMTADPWIVAGGDVDKTVGHVQIAYYDDETGQVDSPMVISGNHVYYPPADITDMVKRWVRGDIDNFGLLLVNNTEYTNNFKASEYSTHTYLDITYIDGCPCDLSADFNYDCRVDLSDFVELADKWEQACTDLDIAPAVGDGFIDLADLIEFADQWLLECVGQGEGFGEE